VRLYFFLPGLLLASICLIWAIFHIESWAGLGNVNPWSFFGSAIGFGVGIGFMVGSVL